MTDHHDATAPLDPGDGGTLYIPLDACGNPAKEPEDSPDVSELVDALSSSVPDAAGTAPRVALFGDAIDGETTREVDRAVRGWFAARDEHTDVRWPWRPYLQLADQSPGLGMTFRTREECDAFIRDSLTGTNAPGELSA
ncbi:hypothetical protein FHX42_005309 [Saccharopolyspora lacisalsi]|uniref:Uncharacterized protein n=1 Tax=Halosaccharopolyspora lacisalsi TaxID=1000566 RepID=A0A839E133_9PSEU|nr:hypothetical protein [Halosaccharopolyspora lacisalsi]MBA8827902.1 hypothetical protein [Halosaccharopolyspora lacisalsi]